MEGRELNDGSTNFRETQETSTRGGERKVLAVIRGKKKVCKVKPVIREGKEVRSPTVKSSTGRRLPQEILLLKEKGIVRVSKGLLMKLKIKEFLCER